MPGNEKLDTRQVEWTGVTIEACSMKNNCPSKGAINLRNKLNQKI